MQLLNNKNKKGYLEQTEIAKLLGISNGSFRRIVHHAGIDNDQHFILINNKRYYKIDEVMEIIRKINK